MMRASTGAVASETRWCSSSKKGVRRQVLVCCLSGVQNRVNIDIFLVRG